LPLANHRVLIVEDEIFIATNLENIVLDARGEVVGPAMSASEALGLAKSQPITAAILDVRLGSHDSLPVAQYLTDAGIPFVFHTGNADTAELLMRWPQAPIVSKPASSQTLVSAIIEASGSSHTGVTTGRF
jgi:DNA-binding NtrC family response regulator